MTHLQASAKPERVQQWRTERVTCFFPLTKRFDEIICKKGNETQPGYDSKRTTTTSGERAPDITEAITISMPIALIAVYYMNVRESLVKFLKAS